MIGKEIFILSLRGQISKIVPFQLQRFQNKKASIQKEMKQSIKSKIKLSENSS